MSTQIEFYLVVTINLQFFNHLDINYGPNQLMSNWQV